MHGLNLNAEMQFCKTFDVFNTENYCNSQTERVNFYIYLYIDVKLKWKNIFRVSAKFKIFKSMTFPDYDK